MAHSSTISVLEVELLSIRGHYTLVRQPHDARRVYSSINLRNMNPAGMSLLIIKYAETNSAHYGFKGRSDK
jgi:hypothetical protein